MQISQPKWGHLQTLPCSLRHLRVLTDKIGILEHACYSVPRLEHGYCTDDNARAATAMLLRRHLNDDDSEDTLLQRYITFVEAAFEPASGRFRNRFSYERRWDSKHPEQYAAAAHGRVVCALGLAVSIGPSSLEERAAQLISHALPFANHCTHPHVLAFLALGLCDALQNKKAPKEWGASLEEIGQRLFTLFDAPSPDWLWWSDTVTWGAAVIPRALFTAGHVLRQQRWVLRGLEVLQWLYDQVWNGEHFSFVGNAGWLCRENGKASFDQQPIEAMTFSCAALDAFQITHDKRWKTAATRSLEWFLGANDHGIPLVDVTCGSCCDGLEVHGVNENRGAESTLSWLITLLSYQLLCHGRRRPLNPIAKENLTVCPSASSNATPAIPF